MHRALQAAAVAILASTASAPAQTTAIDSSSPFAVAIRAIASDLKFPFQVDPRRLRVGPNGTSVAVREYVLERIGARWKFKRSISLGIME